MSYDVIGLIGKGHFGKVYKVKKDNKIIALKVVETKSQEILNKAIKEVELLKEISTPSCVRSLICFTGFFIDNLDIYIESDFIEGKTLLDFAKEKRNSLNFPKYMIAVIKDLIPGLVYLHSKGIIHRDIKPDNIIIETETMQPKLVDFGLACFTKRNLKCENRSNECCPGTAGTPYFMAPETLLKGIAYPESDTWSLGASVYSSITGKMVYDSKKLKELKRKVMTETPIIETGDTILDNILSMMLEKDVRRRISESDIIPEIETMQERMKAIMSE